MTKLASLLGRKPVLVTDTPQPPAQRPAAPASAPASASDRNVLELDQELFFPLASQLGGENEVVRNLLIDAEHKITELDGIRQSLGRLVDPVSKTLRAFEETKNEKLSLQSVLNNTRIAYSKLREDLTTAEKRAATLDTECIRLREVLTVAQQTMSALETTRSEQSAELTARRAQITDLQRLVQQQSTDLQLTREESQRTANRAALAERRMAQLETDTAAASQKAMLADQERAAVQSMLDKALNDAAQTSRRLLDMEKSFTVTQARLKKVETALAEAQSERIRLATALEDATENHRKETIAQNARFEALQARSQLSDKLLEDSRQTLAARANEIGAFERRLTESTTSHGAIETRFSQIEAALAERDAQLRDLEEANAALAERNTELMRGVGTRESAYNRAQEKLQEQDELIEMLEDQIRGGPRDRRAADRRAQGAIAARAARPHHGGRRAGGGPQGYRAPAARDLDDSVSSRTGAGAARRRRPSRTRRS